MIEVALFGGTRVRTEDGRVLGLSDFGGVKPREIFEILLLHRGRVVSKEVLADLLWEGAPPEDALATLESYVSLLRKRVFPGVPARLSPVGTVSGGYRLDAAQVRVDLDEVEALLAEAAQQEPERELRLTRQALLLARGEVLEHQPRARWAQSVRRTWRHRVSAAAVRGAEAALQLGDWERGLVLARRALRSDVLAEDAWRLVMRAHWTAGRRDEALRAYDACRRHLADELGVDPSPQTAQLHAALRSTGVAAREDADVARAVAAVINLVQRAGAPRPHGAGRASDDEAGLILDLLRRCGVAGAADASALAG